MKKSKTFHFFGSSLNSQHENIKNNENEKDDEKSMSLGMKDCMKDESRFSIFNDQAGKTKLHEIPEILEIIFAYFAAAVVRNLRFVNKVWNKEACRVLQFHRDMHLDIKDNSEHQNFIRLLENNAKLKLSLPFRSITLYTDPSSIKILDKILTLDLTTGILIDLQFYDYEDPPSAMSKIMAMGMNKGPVKISLFKMLTNAKLGCSLRSFELGCTSSPSSGILRVLPDPDPEPKKRELPLFYFPALTTITYMGPIGIGNTSTVEYLIEVINSSPNLRSLNLCPDIESDYLKRIFTASNLRSIHHLEFDISAGVLPSAQSLPSIQKLTVTMMGLSQDVLLQRELIYEFSDVLQELDIIWNPKEWNLIENENGFPYCPHLRKLSIHDWGTNIGFFTPEKLPQLKEITFFQDILLTDSNVILLPHQGVEIIRFNRGILYPNDLIPQAQVHRFLRHIAVQFPNVIGLYLTWNIAAEGVHIILNRFKNLEILELSSRCGFKENILTGFGRNQFPHHTDMDSSGNGNERRSTQRKPCLIDLKNLKHLSLQHACKFNEESDDVIPLTYNGVKYGIAKIPNLKTIRINWTSNLPVALLRDELSQLSSIELVIDDQLRKRKDYCDLIHLWPQVKLIPVNLEGPNISWLRRIMNWMKTVVGALH